MCLLWYDLMTSDNMLSQEVARSWSEDWRGRNLRGWEWSHILKLSTETEVDEYNYLASYIWRRRNNTIYLQLGEKVSRNHLLKRSITPGNNLSSGSFGSVFFFRKYVNFLPRSMIHTHEPFEEKQTTALWMNFMSIKNNASLITTTKKLRGIPHDREIWSASMIDDHLSPEPIGQFTG